MTDCNHKTISFAILGRKKILADYNGGKITSDAGAHQAVHKDPN